MSMQRGKLVSGGRLQVPADIRKQLGLTDGDAVVMTVVDGELHVRPARAGLARARQRLRRYVPADMRLSDELIAERRKAAEHE
ncbi:AbrB/MazE/SpoVT family DNA-binding domain-containing protein [Phenylobacterium sp.]|uniref:AbrB/MazE/SpoVT family DNA-binding domain-containing protein n=1 Tax=Phenylobacterium sp. TaxID=1871053 RepID=UPI0035B2C2DD